MKKHRDHAAKRLVIWAWASLCRHTFVMPGVATSTCHDAVAREPKQVPIRGWYAKAYLPALWAQWRSLVRLAEGLWHVLAHLHAATKVMVLRDKREFLRDMAFNAAVAAESGDSRQSFRIIRLLGGFSPRKPKSVLLEDGSVAQDYQQGAERWERHFVSLFAGKRLEHPS